MPKSLATRRGRSRLQELDDPPAGLLFRGIFTIRPEPQQEMLGAQGLEQALGVGGRIKREVKLLTHGERWQGCLLRGLVM